MNRVPGWVSGILYSGPPVGGILSFHMAHSREIYGMDSLTTSRSISNEPTNDAPPFPNVAQIVDQYQAPPMTAPP